jgi:regulator of sirC expression with transglutaminase-like and TPR domain
MDDKNGDKKNKIALFSAKREEKEREEMKEELDLVEKVINDVESNIRQVFTNEVNFRTLLQVLYDKNIVTEEEILSKYNQVVQQTIRDRLKAFGLEVSDEEEED